MSTLKQKKTIQKLSENIRKPLGQAMREAGYSLSTSKSPQLLTKSKGFQELCEEVGLTPKLITSALVEDIKKKKYNRARELELGARITKLIEKEDTNVNIGFISLTKLYEQTKEGGESQKESP